MAGFFFTPKAKKNFNNYPMSVVNNVPPKPAALTIVLAFTGLYIIWGSTYLAIFVAIKTIPPYILVSLRYLIAGFLLLTYCFFQKEKIPSLSNIVTIGISGILMLVIGNGALTWAEQYLPTGLAAIIVSTLPLWFVILDKKQWSYYFDNKIILLGVVVGFIGVILLFSESAPLKVGAGNMQNISFIIVLVGTICWGVGSLFSKYKAVAASTTMKAAIQMLIAGVSSIFVSMALGEQNNFSFTYISLQSWLAVAYLVVMGSLVGYMSYIWLLSVRAPSIVGTYAYVNPVVAVILGVWLAEEQITFLQVLALFIVLSGVLLVNLPFFIKRKK